MTAHYKVICAATDLPGHESSRGVIYFAPDGTGGVPPEVDAQRQSYETASAALRASLVASNAAVFDRLFKELLAGAQLLRGETPKVAEASRALVTFHQSLKQAEMSGSPQPAQSAPAIVMISGVAFLGVTLLFLMSLVFRDSEVSCSKRMLVVFAFAMSTAIGSGLMGGSAVAKGSIPLPAKLRILGQNHPVVFALTGGIAVLVIVILIGYGTYTCSVADADIDIEGSWRVPSYPDRFLTCSHSGAHVSCDLNNADFTHHLDGEYETSTLVSGILQRASVPKPECKWTANFVIQLKSDNALDLAWDVITSLPGCDLPSGAHVSDPGYQRVTHKSHRKGT